MKCIYNLSMVSIPKDTTREYAILMVEKFIADVEENFERLRDFLDNKCESCVALLEQQTYPCFLDTFHFSRF